MASKQ